MRILLAVLVAAGCDYPSDEAAPDAQPSNRCDDSLDPVRVINRTVAGPFSGSVATIGIVPTTSDTVLVVSVTNQHDGNDSPVASMSMSGVPLGPWLLVEEAPCSKSGQISVGRELPAGLDALRLEMNRASTFDVHVLEVAGARASLRDPYRHVNYGSAPPTTESAFVDACPGDLVVSTIVSCAELYGIARTSAFTSLGIRNDSDTAFLIPPERGRHGAEWSFAGGATSSVTVVFGREL